MATLNQQQFMADIQTATSMDDLRQCLMELSARHEAALIQNHELVNSALAQAEAAQSSADSKGTGSSHVRYNKPDEFRGDKKEVQSFLFQLQLRFLAEPRQFANDMTKLVYAIGFLKGPAARWILPAQRKGLPESFPTYAAFEEALRADYGGLHEIQIAERELDELRQRGSCIDYTTEFLRITALLSWNDEALRSAYRRGLSSEIKDQLIHEKRGDTLQDLIIIAKEIDGRIRERNMEKYGDRSRTFKPRIPFKPFVKRVFEKEIRTTPAMGGGPVPMDLDATQTRYPRMSPKKQVQFRERKCFECDKTGHMARDCPERRTQSKN